MARKNIEKIEKRDARSQKTVQEIAEQRGISTLWLRKLLTDAGVKPCARLATDTRGKPPFLFDVKEVRAALG